MPTVSVIMPVYNCDLYIMDAVNSILNQTFSDFELIIIDDASSDNTAVIIEKISDSRINFIQKKTNTGYTNSLNMGLQIAKGKYIARMDGDDISLADRFEKQVKCLEQNNEIAVCGTWYQMAGTDKVNRHPSESEDIKIALLETNSLGHPTVMFRKGVIDEYNLKYDATLEPGEDYDLWVQIIEHKKIINIPEVLLTYRLHENQVSVIREMQQNAAASKTRIKLLGYLYDKPPSIHITEEIKFGDNVEKNKERLLLFIKEIENVKKLNTEKKFFSAKAFQHFLNDKKRMAIKSFFNHPQTSGWRYLFLFLFNKNSFYRNFKNNEKLKVIYRNLLFMRNIKFTLC